MIYLNLIWLYDCVMLRIHFKSHHQLCNVGLDNECILFCWIMFCLCQVYVIWIMFDYLLICSDHDAGQKVNNMLRQESTSFNHVHEEKPRCSNSHAFYNSLLMLLLCGHSLRSNLSQSNYLMELLIPHTSLVIYESPIPSPSEMCYICPF
jgi:hypothetical protein